MPFQWCNQVWQSLEKAPESEAWIPPTILPSCVFAIVNAYNLCVHVRACVRASVRACARVCVFVCARVRVRACMCVHVHARLLYACVSLFECPDRPFALSQKNMVIIASFFSDSSLITACYFLFLLLSRHDYLRFS